MSASAAGTSHITSLDWLMIALYFAALAGVAWWVVRKQKDSAADYFLAGRNLGWWIIGASIFASNIGSEHIVGLAGRGRHRRRRHGALRTARLVPAGAGLGLRAVLHAVDGLHDAGIPGAPVQRKIALCALHRLADHVCHFQNRGRHFRRRRGLRHAAAGNAPEHWQHQYRQLLDRLRAGDPADRPLHDARRHARGGLQRRRAGGRPHRRLGAADDLRPDPTGRLERAAALVRIGDVQPVEAAGAGGSRKHLVAGDGDRRGGESSQASLVFQRRISLAGHAVLRADHRALVLVHGPIHRAAGAGRAQRATMRAAAASSRRSSSSSRFTFSSSPA